MTVVKRCHWFLLIRERKGERERVRRGTWLKWAHHSFSLHLYFNRGRQAKRIQLKSLLTASMVHFINAGTTWSSWQVIFISRQTSRVLTLVRKKEREEKASVSSYSTSSFSLLFFRLTSACQVMQQENIMKDK